MELRHTCSYVVYDCFPAIRADMSSCYNMTNLKYLLSGLFWKQKEM